VPSPACADTFDSGQCAGYRAQGYCTQVNWIPFMQQGCAASCSFCAANAPLPTWATPSPMWVTPVPRPPINAPYPVWPTPSPTWATPSPTWATPSPTWATPSPTWASTVGVSYIRIANVTPDALASGLGSPAGLVPVRAQLARYLSQYIAGISAANVAVGSIDTLPEGGRDSLATIVMQVMISGFTTSGENIEGAKLTQQLQTDITSGRLSSIDVGCAPHHLVLVSANLQTKLTHSLKRVACLPD
jgi:hypothetical protein